MFDLDDQKEENDVAFQFLIGPEKSSKFSWLITHCSFILMSGFFFPKK
jgi:hypothetical protein